MADSALQEKAERLRQLHGTGKPLVLPNAWDVGSAVVFAAAGCPALATSSAGIAFAAGFPDGERMPRDAMLAAVGRIAARVAVPVSADMEAGYGATPEDVADTVRGVIAAGAVGINIEDGLDGGGLRDPADMLARLRAARMAADAAGVPLFLNARTDVFWQRIGPEDQRLALAVERLRAYRDAGADGLFVPGRMDLPTIRGLAAATDLPLNVLGGAGMPPIPELASAGVARVTVGSGPMRAAMGVVRAIAEELAGPGTYERILGVAIPYPDLNALFADDPQD
ncbi:isocitrate lyase/phosphoenolpyruvate mutase family protein [Azospirillum formosense]|uniref:Isocitrate lyase/phosphoenolpyruvate mutase family protein n=1 Tax=Azospirillum formosense TaxID=861533 RepID=A0ABX2L3S1_9PROT|nr:isocitrate lyase/phosphoenolpyruvate mutase family protein [Azospirillum formosense]MBY3756040.1 isocitrate lyase/phosphoenolpyruvate mutase family protein [Azospirillum formosense]NUB20761.1 isocitrate lyase/phosphoenolpyruvate mutase family protein [Azospirillum formosense]